MRIQSLLIVASLFLSHEAVSQTLYVPSGTSGIGSSSTANIGIGISNPAEKLTINGSVRGNQSGALRISTGYGYMDIGPKNTSLAHFYTDRPAYYFDKEIKVNSGYVGSYNSPLYLRTSGTTRMTIKTEGNIGVGCDPGTIPFKIYNADLPVFELASQRSRLNVLIGPDYWPVGDPLSACRGDVVFRNLGESHNMLFWIPDDLNDGSRYIGFGDALHNIWMKITNNKFVRINGTLIATKMMVKTNVWSDFVFDSDYKLQTLEEIEKFIKINKHLPDVPSAKQVIEEGIDVAKMNVILLQKVEELTLLMIEQNKTIQILKNQIENAK